MSESSVAQWAESPLLRYPCQPWGPETWCPLCSCHPLAGSPGKSPNSVEMAPRLDKGADNYPCPQGGL